MRTLCNGAARAEETNGFSSLPSVNPQTAQSSDLIECGPAGPALHEKQTKRSQGRSWHGAGRAAKPATRSARVRAARYLFCIEINPGWLAWRAGRKAGRLAPHPVLLVAAGTVMDGTQGAEEEREAAAACRGAGGAAHAVDGWMCSSRAVMGNNQQSHPFVQIYLEQCKCSTFIPAK